MKQINWVDHLLSFVSVILGVSLAFYISDNAAKTKERRELKFYLTTMLEEIEDDIYTYEDYQIPDNEDQVENLNKALATLSTQENLDSLNYFINEAFNINSYFPQNITFESLISSGKLDLINDFELKNNLLQYKLSSKELEYQGTFQLDFFTDRILPWFIENPGFTTSFDGLENRQDFKVILGFYTDVLSNKTRKYSDLVEDAKVIRDDLKDLLIKEYDYAADTTTVTDDR